MPARAPAGKPPDGQGRRRGDGDGFLRAAIQAKADFRQLFRLIPDGAADLPIAGIAPQLLGVDALYWVRAVHTAGAKTYLIIPILILPEPDDVPLVRSFFAPEHGKAVLPVVLHRQQLDGAGPPARHLPAEEPGDLSGAVAADGGIVCGSAEKQHKADSAKNPAGLGGTAHGRSLQKTK